MNIEETNIIDVDKNKINFIIEVRKENQKFEQNYEGIKANYIIKYISQEITYEIKICSSYTNINNQWTQIKKMKTLKVLFFVMKV